jgi:hypothetical protein
MRVKLVPEHNKIAAAPIAGSNVLFAFPEHAPPSYAFSSPEVCRKPTTWGPGEASSGVPCWAGGRGGARPLDRAGRSSPRV